MPIEVLLQRREGCEDVPLPTYMTAHAAGMDLAAAVDCDFVLSPGQIACVPTGFSMALPPGYEAQIRPRSGLALKHGVTVANAPGTIDADYRGEVSVILINLGREVFEISRSMRIAQMVIAPVAKADVREVASLPDSARGSGGFGSTGHGGGSK